MEPLNPYRAPTTDEVERPPPAWTPERVAWAAASVAAAVLAGSAIVAFWLAILAVAVFASTGRFPPWQ